MPRASRYGFRTLAEEDLPMIGAWLTEPHVAAWWDEAPKALADIRQDMDSISVEPLIIEIDGEAAGYIQAYDPHLEDDHPYADQPMGTLGIDQFIGRADLVHVGHGPRLIRAFVEQLFEEGAPRVIVDPDPENRIAIRAYEKAGFRALDRRASFHGQVLLMALDAEE